MRRTTPLLVVVVSCASDPVAPPGTAGLVEGQAIPHGAEWRFWDRGGDPGRAWRTPSFDDAAWPRGAGPLGYGKTYLATEVSSGSDPDDEIVTTYFRRWFHVDAPSARTTLMGELMYDDGVVVHLNGHEIERLHMPAGWIEPGTRATEHDTGDDYEHYDWSEHNGRLVPGANLLAVEVHQAEEDSSDLAFDLALDVETPPVCAVPGCEPAVAPPPSAPLRGVWVGPSAVWAVGDAGAIGRRAPDGDWCWCAPDPDVSWRAVWGSADDDVWMVGGAGHVRHFDGARVATVDVGADAALTDVWGSGPDEVFIVGDAGTVRRYDGASWEALDLPPDQSLATVWGASTQDVWIGGSEPAPYPGNPAYDGRSSVIYRWQPATATWALEASYTMYYGVASFDGMHGTGPEDVWAVGTFHPAGAAASQSQAVHYDGTEWSVVDVPDELAREHRYTDVTAGAPGAEDGIWVVGGSNALRYAGGTWTAGEEPITTGLAGVDVRDGQMWAVGLGFAGGLRHKILRWDGAAWVRDW